MWARCCIAAVALLAGLSAASAQSGSSDKQSDGRFTGIALITDDRDWFDRFQRAEPPEISGRDRFAPGEEGALAIIFSNAEPLNGTVRVECDVTAFDPEGSSAVVENGVCYEGPYRGDNILHPALLDLQFAIGPDDPPGRAGFRIVLRDAHGRQSVNLAVEFTQVSGE